MYPDEQQVSDLRLEIGLLKKDSQQLSNITDKLSLSIDKIQEMNGNLVRMLALHDQQHQGHLKTEDDLKEDIKELHSRVTTVTRELHDKIDDVEKHLGGKIDDLRKDLLTHKQEEVRIRPSQILAKIENYKFLILGIVLAAGFFLGNLNTGLVGILFK
jgi:chromosome segregation ATPase